MALKGCGRARPRRLDLADNILTKMEASKTPVNTLGLLALLQCCPSFRRDHEGLSRAEQWFRTFGPGDHVEVTKAVERQLYRAVGKQAAELLIRRVIFTPDADTGGSAIHGSVVH